MFLDATPAITQAITDFGVMLASGVTSLNSILSTDIGKIGLAGIVGFICIALVGATIGLVLTIKARKR